MISYHDIKTKELFDMYNENHSVEIRNELVNRHIYIAEILSKKYINKGIEYDDIFQVACLALVYAVDRFDPTKGFEFSSFATPTIVGEIKKYFRDKGWTIRVPRRIQELSKKITIAKEKLYKDLSRAPTIKDIAEYLNVSDDEIIETMDASKVYNTKSLDLEIESSSDDRDVKLLDIVGQEDEAYDMIDNQDFIKSVMEELNPVEKRIIEERFFNGKTQIMVANELNVSQMTVSRMEKKIISKFKEEYLKVNNI